MTATARRAPTDVPAFLAWENRQKDRYELIRGVVRMMSGGTRAHDLIAMNLVVALRRVLPKTCDVHGSNFKVRLAGADGGLPDMFVRCGPPADDRATEVGDPVLVVEVLSRSTRRDDLIGKRWGYQAIPSLQHILFVESERLQVEAVERETGDVWRSVTHRRAEEVVALQALGVTLTLAEIYAGTAAA